MKHRAFHVAFLVACMCVPLCASATPSLTWTLNLERGTVNFGRYAPYAGSTYPITLTGGDSGVVYTGYVMSDDGQDCLAETAYSNGAYSVSFSTEGLRGAFVRDMHEMRTFHCIFRDPSRVVAEGDLTVVWNPLWKDTSAGAVYTMKGERGRAGEQGEKGDDGFGDPAALAFKWPSSVYDLGMGNDVFGYDSSGKLHFYEALKDSPSENLEDTNSWQIVTLNTLTTRIEAEKARARAWESAMEQELVLSNETHTAEITYIYETEVLPYQEDVCEVEANSYKYVVGAQAALDSSFRTLTNDVDRAKGEEEALKNGIEYTSVYQSNVLGELRGNVNSAKNYIEGGKEYIKLTNDLCDKHIPRSDNPHKVTAEQVGAYTKQETKDLAAQLNPVQSVNDMTGDVVLQAGVNILALPCTIDDWARAFVTSNVYFEGGYFKEVGFGGEVGVYNGFFLTTLGRFLSSGFELETFDTTLLTEKQGNAKYARLDKHCFMIPVKKVDTQWQYLRAGVIKLDGEYTLCVSQTLEYLNAEDEWVEVVQ